MAVQKLSRGTFLFMEDRKNDWLAHQLEEEKRAEARINAMFGIRFRSGPVKAASGDARALRDDHFASCDAGRLKKAHEANCDAAAVRNSSRKKRNNTGRGV